MRILHTMLRVGDLKRAIASVGLSLYDLLGRRWLYLLLDWSVITMGVIVVTAALVTLRIRRVA